MLREDALRRLIDRHLHKTPEPFILKAHPEVVIPHNVLPRGDFRLQAVPRTVEELMPRFKLFLGEPDDKTPWADGVCVQNGVAIACNGSHRAILYPVPEDEPEGLHRSGWVEKEHTFPANSTVFKAPEAISFIPVSTVLLRALAELALECASKWPVAPFRAFVALGPTIAAAISSEKSGVLGTKLTAYQAIDTMGPTTVYVGASYLRDALLDAGPTVLLGTEAHSAPVHIWRADGEKHVIMPRREEL